MSLYAIGDLHLSLGTNKPMDVFGAGWDGYVAKITEGFKPLDSEDVCVICGDLTWGMTLEESLPDFLFIDALPGKKIILKGNHDYWWSTASKASKFFYENGITTISILNNNCYFYKGAAICGTRGWLIDEAKEDEHGRKILSREVMRLEASLKAAGETATKLCFFHYPPRFYNYVCHEIIEAMKKYGVRDCWYGHIHGHGQRYAVTGRVDDVGYNLVSADYLNFAPIKIMV